MGPCSQADAASQADADRMPRQVTPPPPHGDEDGADGTLLPGAAPLPAPQAPEKVVNCKAGDEAVAGIRAGQGGRTPTPAPVVG